VGNVKKDPPILLGYVMHINHTIQGHPESPHIWEGRIDGILCHLNAHPTIREPCLNVANINDNQILWLCQVDVLLVAAKDSYDA